MTTYTANTTSDSTTSGSASNGARTKRERRMDEARAILEQGVSEVRSDPEALRRYLAFRAHFHDYSRHNTMLILMQRPTAKYCMGYRSWQKHGRQVKKGERGIMIWAPILRKPTDEEIAEGADPDERLVRGYRVTYTFDYEQTKATTDDALVYESPIPTLEGDDYAHLYASLKAVANRWGYAITESDGYAEGYCHFRRRAIGLRRDLPVNSRAAVLAHELAHAFAHEPAKGRSFTRAEAELQAEGAAFLACYALGLDTSHAALPYLKSYADDDEALWAQLARIEEIAWTLVREVRSE